MISTIRRQAASCIFGLAPHIRDMIEHRFQSMNDDPELDFEDYDLDSDRSETSDAKILNITPAGSVNHGAETVQ